MDGYQDEGETLLNGGLVEVWGKHDWDPFFPPITYDYLYVDQRVPSAARPVLAETAVRPLGVTVLSINTTYTAWNAGPQPSSAFSVHGLDECPMSRSCSDGWEADPLRAARRAATRALRRSKAAKAA